MASPDDQAVPQIAALRVTPRQARGRDKLARMLDAADHILATEGVDAVTTTRIAAGAGISIGSVYRYLPNRGAVIDALAQHYLGLLEEHLEALIGTLDTGAWRRADVVGDVVDAFAWFYRDHPGFRALWFGRPLTADAQELDRAHKLRMATRLRTVLQARGVQGDDESTLAASRVVQLSTDAVIQEAFRTDPQGDHALLEHLKTMLRSYLTAAGLRL